AEKLAWEKEKWKEEAELERAKWEETKAWEKEKREDEKEWEKEKRADDKALAFKVQKYQFVRSALERGMSIAEAKEWLAMVEQ
ncbi:hypothetical protein BGZ72_002938, partial [Mortierella alpina]